LPIRSVLSDEKKLSMAALSQMLPDRNLLNEPRPKAGSMSRPREEVDHAATLNARKTLGWMTAPVRRFLPHLMDLVLDRKINPGKVFDLELPLSEVAEGYRAMDERPAIKVPLRV
jgi:threonine dehydrogenase-like Zn-dependent dehydrogenase